MDHARWLGALIMAGALTGAQVAVADDKSVNVHVLDDATPETVVSVIQYLNPQALRPGTALYRKYYSPEKLHGIAQAIIDTCREHNHPVALYVAYFHEQSRFQYDAVSRWNPCDPGEPHCTQVGDDWYRRVPRDKAWSKPVRGLDYGMAQIHYPANRLVTQDDIKKLKDPVFATKTFARWLDRSMARCERANTARCREMKKLTGWSWHRRPGPVVRYLREIIDVVQGGMPS